MTQKTKEQNDERKTFVLDTNVLKNHPDAVLHFAEHNLVIPSIVIRELDNLKKGLDSTAFNARESVRVIYGITQGKKGPVYSLGEGKGTLSIVTWKHVDAFSESQETNDDKILAIAFDLKMKGHNVTLITQDYVLLIKASVVGVNAENYNHDSIRDVSLLDNPILEAPNAESLKPGDKLLYYNMPIKICHPGREEIGRWDGKKLNSIDRAPIGFTGIKAKNLEQDFAVDIMFDPSINVVAVTGCAGSGKTLLAVACGIAQHEKYPNLLVTRMIVDLENRSYGYVPGNLDEKSSAYFDPIRDVLEEMKFSGKDKWLKGSKKEDILSVAEFKIFHLPTSRGRTIRCSWIIIDEAQNLSLLTLKTILTRAGNGTKFIFIGDVNQIDMPGLTKTSNGISYLIDRFRGEKNFAFIDLPQSERSELAEMAAKLL